MIGIQFEQERGIGAFREFRFFIDQRHDVAWPLSNHIQHILIVNEFDVFPDYFLFGIFLLFHLKRRMENSLKNYANSPHRLRFYLEYLLHEELLQTFVGIIDAQLLEIVHRKILEAKNVQNAN